MFPLFHDRTRRQICRVLFLLFGVLPTGAVIAWSAVVNGDGFRSAACEKISAALGSDVRAISIYHPREEIAVLKGFDVFDPETGTAWFHSPHVEVHSGEQLQTIEVQRPEMSLAGHNWWLPIVQRRLRLSKQPQPPLRVDAGEVSLTWPSGKQTLRNCTVEISASAEGNMAALKFQWGDKPTTDPVELRFRRTSEAGQSISWIELNTGTAAIPCSLLSGAMQQDNLFGPVSTFRGKLLLHDGRQGWTAKVTDGQIEQVDLQTLVQHHFAGDCRGTAQISLQHAIFRNEQAVEMQGAIKAGAGEVSGAVFDALRFSLLLHPPLNSTTPATLSFDQLAAEFALASTSLSITGKCDSSPDRVVLRTANQPLLSDPGRPLTPWWRW